MSQTHIQRAPATPAQQRLWLVDQQGPRGIEFSFPYLFELNGPCDPVRLADAVTTVLSRHTPLRTTFELVDDVLHQVVHEVHTGDVFTVADLSGFDRPDDEVAHLVADEVAIPFDLTVDWPTRVRLYRLGDERFQLLFNVHHIATDGLSMQIMLDEIGMIYAGEEPAPICTSYVELPAPPARADAAAEDFWRRVLTDAPAAVRLPTRRAQSTRRSFSGRWYDAVLSADEVGELEQITKASGGTVYSALFGLLAVALSRRTGMREVVLGVPFASRRPEEEALVGFFINLLPVRFGVDESMTFAELLAASGGTVTAALEHSHVPLDRVLTQADARAGGVNALLNVALNEEDTPRLKLCGLDVVHRALRIDVARYHIAVDYRKLPGGAIQLEVSYAKDQLDRADVASLVDDLRALVTAAVAEPGQRLATGSTTVGPVSVVVNDEPAPVADSLEALWREVVATRSDQVGVVDKDGTLSFAELDGAATAYAERLREAGVRPDDTVALVCRRSRDFPIALLGTLMVAATPVLLDAAHPPARLASLARQAGAALVASSPGLATELPVDLPRLEVTAGKSTVSGTAWERSPGGLAYVVYTSGSTGTPKCIGVTEANLLRLLANLSSLSFAEPGTVLALNASFGFDASVQQWSRLFAGCTLVVLDEEARLDPELLIRRLDSSGASELDVSPRHLEAILDVLLEYCSGREIPLRVLVGGEAISAALWNRLRIAASDGLLDAWNVYGPTECTVDSTTFPVALTADPTIGLPMPGVRAYVLDEWLRPVPPGAPGWLYVAGEGVARAYLGAPGATARAFVADPIQADGSRMYATGDRARLRPDGCMDYLGRGDDQVKVSGYRVELAEVEHAAQTHPGVRTCAADVDTDAADPVLHLYVVADQATVDALPAWLRGALPTFMVPKRITRIATVPLTPQGKIDRAALRTTNATDPPVDQEPAPSNTERVLAEVWRGVLSRDEISGDDDFFSLGGHSLLAIRVVARVRKEMNVVVPIASVFAHPVLRALARHVDQLRAKA